MACLLLTLLLALVAVTVGTGRVSAAVHGYNGIRFIDDAFQRTVLGGLGTAPLGGSYGLVNAARFSALDGQATVGPLSAGSSATASLTASSVADELVALRFALPALPHSGSVAVSVLLRKQSNGDGYRATVEVRSDGSMDLQFLRARGGAAQRIGPELAVAGRAVAGRTISLEGYLAGSRPTFAARAWPLGMPAPYWPLTGADDSTLAVSSAGGAGVSVAVPSGSSTSTVAMSLLRAWRLQSPVPDGRVIISADFNATQPGPVSPAAFQALVGATDPHPAGYSDMSFAPDTRGSGMVLRTTLQAGTIRGEPAGNHGEVLVVKLPSTYDRACISYDVRFSPGFDWSLGGKLPGLVGVSPGVSPSTPEDGGSTANGWSARLMWLGPGAYSWAGPTDMAVTYFYHPGQAGQWGDNVRWNRPFAAGQWHYITQCQTMNTVGEANGVLEVWMDGLGILNDTHVVYRTRSDVHITHLDFSVFRGGDSLAWAGRSTGYVDIDNLAILAG